MFKLRKGFKWLRQERLTATFADGTQTTRTTARTYTHVVEVITKFQMTNCSGKTTNHTRTEQKMVRQT